jgi:short-subunit dehydrogenase
LKTLGATVLSVLTDVSKPNDVQHLAQKTVNTFGEVHLLCNNAGVTVPGVSWEHTLDDWKWVMNVNLWGVIHGIRTFVPIMQKQDTECHIVNTSSLSGLMAEEVGEAIYIVTKYGVAGLSEILSRELSLLKSKIKISVLCPGMVKTNIIDAERNRPDGYPETAKRTVHPELEQIEEAILGMFEKGISPEKVGDMVFHGIKNDLFYILTDTHRYYKRMIKSRFDGILEAFEQNRHIHKSLEKS